MGWWRHRFRKYTDLLSTLKSKGAIFKFIHSVTQFQKISVSLSQNARSVWTKHLYYTKCMHIQRNASPCGRGLEVHKVVTMKKNQHYKKYIKEHEIPSNNFARSKISVDSKFILGRQSLHWTVTFFPCLSLKMKWCRYIQWLKAAFPSIFHYLADFFWARSDTPPPLRRKNSKHHKRILAAGLLWKNINVKNKEI